MNQLAWKWNALYFHGFDHYSRYIEWQIAHQSPSSYNKIILKQKIIANKIINLGWREYLIYNFPHS